MDILVTAASDGKSWKLKDLLGRSFGTIEQNSPTEFVLRAEGPARDKMALLHLKAFASLDDLLGEIERHTRGRCRESGRHD